MIAIEYGDEFPRSFLQRVVQVARLGMAVVGADDVDHADFLCEQAEFLSSTVVQDVDFELVPGPVYGDGRENRGFHHVDRFIVGWNENIDTGPEAGVRRQGG